MESAVDGKVLAFMPGVPKVIKVTKKSLIVQEHCFEKRFSIVCRVAQTLLFFCFTSVMDLGWPRQSKMLKKFKICPLNQV
jgi:hypothetical protein